MQRRLEICLVAENLPSDFAVPFQMRGQYKQINEVLLSISTAHFYKEKKCEIKANFKLFNGNIQTHIKLE